MGDLLKFSKKWQVLGWFWAREMNGWVRTTFGANYFSTFQCVIFEKSWRDHPCYNRFILYHIMSRLYIEKSEKWEQRRFSCGTNVFIFYLGDSFYWSHNTLTRSKDIYYSHWHHSFTRRGWRHMMGSWPRPMCKTWKWNDCSKLLLWHGVYFGLNFEH